MITKRFVLGRPIFKAKIENNDGVFEVSGEKRFCHNQYNFKAKQVAVRVNDILHHVNNVDSIRVNRLSHLTATRAFNQEELTNNKLTDVIEIIKIKEFGAYFEGRILDAKRYFDMFCHRIKSVF